MFYCDECRDKKEWPDTFAKSDGQCEVCRKYAVCNDMPSRSLPTPKRKTPNQDTD